MTDSEHSSTWAIFKQLISFLKPYYLWVTIRIISTLAKASIDIAVILLVQMMVNAALNGDGKGLERLICSILGLVVIEAIMYFMSTYSSGRFSVYASRDIKEKLNVQIEKLPLSYIENRHSGELVSVLNNSIVRIEDFFKSSLIDFIYEIIRFMGCLIFMLLLNWQLLLICIVIISITIVMSDYITRPVGKYTEELQVDLGKANKTAQDSIGGIQLLKAFNLGKVLSGKYKFAINRTLADSIAIAKRTAMVGTASVIMNIVPVILCFLLGGYMVVIGRFTAGGLVAFGQMLMFMGQAAGAIPGYISEFKKTMGVSKHVFEVLNESAERTDGEKHDVNITAPAIEFEEVSFAYNGQVGLLNNLSFKIPHGNTVALVGTSGGGKTTILKLLCGFYEVNSGCIRLYGENLNTWNLKSARALISIVPQDTYLFHGTIAENIAYGRYGANFEEIVQAAKASNSHDFITNLPEGYNTIVEERGSRLSIGQRQRISIARAILKNAPVLLLDEPTSALDAESERLIQEALETFSVDRTVFVIAHRLSTIRNAHKVLVLDKGKIVNSGLHNDLIQQEGIYKQLYLKQLISYSENKSFPARQGAY